MFPGSPKTQYTVQYYLEVQRALPWEMVVALGDAGAGSRHLINITNINLPLTPHPTVPVSQRRRLRTDLNQILEVNTDTDASYKSLFVKWEKRFSGSVAFLNSLTWSQARDAAVEVLSGAGGGGPTDPYDWRSGWGNSSQDRRLVYAGSLMWELPFGQSRRWLQSGPASWVLGDWQASVIYRAITGPYASNTAPDTQNNGGAARGTYVRSPNLPSSERTEERWFDTGFAVQSDPGVVSNVGRNIIELPGYHAMDASLVKTIMGPRGSRFQLRFETFNTLNIANWGNPGLALGGANYGKITGRAGEQRRLSVRREVPLLARQDDRRDERASWVNGTGLIGP